MAMVPLLVGCSSALRYRRGQRQVDEFIGLIEELRAKIRYYKLPLGEIFAELKLPHLTQFSHDLREMSFGEALSDASGSELKLLPYEGETQNSIKTVLKNNADSKSVCIFIGPEGGFDKSEVEHALDAGFNIVTLGPRILRTETAPLAAISAVLYELGDW